MSQSLSLSPSKTCPKHRCSSTRLVRSHHGLTTREVDENKVNEDVGLR